ncbi:MAG: hypothetical protein ACYTGN_13960 [Planctomycetota bacterium]|jgi:hypothetical protein
MGWRTVGAAALVLAAFAAGVALGQDDKGDLQERLAQVRREVKVIDLDDSLARLPAFLEREKHYSATVRELKKAGGDGKAVIAKLRDIKLKTLADLNLILRKHKSEHCGIEEGEVWERLRNARFRNVSYDNAWLVNILDDLEERCQINIELDARIYKFDSVSFDFDKTSARAMLQIMGDTLLFNWIVRGDTLYVYKERHEVLFGGEWIRRKKAAFKARQAALEKARKEAERKALEGDG